MTTTQTSSMSRGTIRQTGHEYYIIALIVVLAILQGIGFAAITPFTRGPDEQHYYAEVEQLASSGTFKSFSGHPPLYPSVASLVFRLGELTGNGILFTRILGVLFNAGTVYLTSLTSAALFTDRFKRLAPPLLVALNPEFNFVGAAINSDALLTLCATAFFFLSVKSIETSLQDKYAVGLVVVAILGPLTKQRFLVLYPLYFPLLACCLYRRFKWHESTIHHRGRFLRIALGVGACLLFMVLWVTNLVPTLNPWTWFQAPGKAWIIMSDTRFATKLFRDFWGNFDWQILPLSRATYTYFLCLMVISFAGFVLLALRSLIKLKNKELTITWRAMVYVVFLLGIALSVYSVAQYATQIRTGVSGRYLLVAIAPIAVLMATGLSAFVRERAFKCAYTALAVTLVAVNYLEFAYNVVPFYY